MSEELKQVFETPTGERFETKQEALDFMRRPKIKEALMKLTDGAEDLCDWLIDNQDVVENAVSTGTIRRVTKSERNKLQKALEHAVALNDKKLDFLTENAEAIVETFRWPTVKRMTDEEKAVAARNTLLTATADEDGNGNEQLADYVIKNQEAILECYEAGKVKRKVSDKAMEALAKYRAEKAAEKAAAEGKEEAAA